MLWWLKNSCLMGQWEGLNTVPLQMASLYTERHTVLVPLTDSAKHKQDLNFLTFCLQNFLTWGPWECELMICHHIWRPPLFITLFVCPLCDSQRKEFKQDVQAQEEYPGGFSSVRAVETCRGYAGKWKPAYGSHVAWGGRLKWVGRSQQ